MSTTISEPLTYIEDFVKHHHEFRSKHPTSIEDFLKLYVLNACYDMSRSATTGFERLDRGTHLVRFTIPPYIIERSGLYYTFESAQLGLTLNEGGMVFDKYLSIAEPPRLLHDYRHPFVYPEGSIWGAGTLAYGCNDWEERAGYRFGATLNLSNEPVVVAKKIALLLKIGQYLLENGFINSATYKILPLESCNQIADSKEGAELYAKKEGISLGRIISNNP